METGNKMSFEDVMDLIRILAHSQGMYGRMLETIENNPDLYDKLSIEWDNKFVDDLDFIMSIEGA